MATTWRHLAGRDLITKTTVRPDAVLESDPDEYHVERQDDSAAMPSRLRRSTMDRRRVRGDIPLDHRFGRVDH